MSWPAKQIVSPGPGESAPNTRLLLLSLVAGCVDALAFIHAGVFPANMTGNSVVLALALGRVEVGGALLPAVALGGFCLGVALGAGLLRGTEPAWSRRTNGTLLLAGGLLLGGAIGAATGASMLPLLVGTAALAMGLQSAAVQRIGVAGVATVVVTGTLTTTITRLVESALPPVEGHPTADPRLPLGSWAGYFAGALLGGLPHLIPALAPAIYFGPGLLLVGVAWRARSLH